MREMQSAGAFVRGWETLSHFVTMFRTASLRHILLSATIAALLASASMLGELGEQKHLLGGYTRAAIHEWFSIKDTVSLELPDGSSPTLPTHAAYRRYVDAFGGRTYGFLWRQWTLRLLFGLLLIAPGLAWLMVAFGRKLSRARTLRGGLLIDTTKETNGEVARVAERLALLAGACVVGAAAAVFLRHGDLGHFRTALAYGTAWLASVSSTVAQVFSPDWSGSSIWVSTAAASGLLAPKEALQFYRLELGQSLVGFVSMTLAGGVGGGLLAKAAFTRIGARDFRTANNWPAIRFGSEELPPRMEPSGVIIAGGVGSGKSVAIKSMADTIRARGQRAIVNDPKGDLTALYYRPGYDIILNPLDERCAPWTPWAEIRNRSDFARLAKSLFPPLKGGNEFFSISGASLFAAITERLSSLSERPSNQELAYVLTKATIEEVAQVVEGTVAARYMESKTGDMSSNLLATLSAQLEPMTYLPDTNGEPGFSLRSFIEEQGDRWLFITMRPEDEAVLRPLLTCWYDVALEACLSLPDLDPSKPIEEHRRIFCLLDEVTRLGQLPALPGALREGRSKGLAVTLGLQSVADVRNNYGRDLAEAILGQPQTALVLRTTEPDTAKWLERLLGRAEKERTSESQSMGANSQRDGVNLSRQVNTTSLVLDTELQTLPNLTGYLKVVNEPLKKIQYRWKNSAPERNDPPQPGFLPRATLPVPTRPGWLREPGEDQESWA